MISSKPLQSRAFNHALKVGLALAIGVSTLQSAVNTAGAAAPVLPAACQKVFTKVINADKVYVALQYGVVKAATDFVASNSLSNRLVYNESYVNAIKAANTELSFAIANPQCYPAKNIVGYRANIKHNLAQIAGIYTANVHGQVVGNPTKMQTFKPVGLLK